jgi:hypothetical protein
MAEWLHFIHPPRDDFAATMRGRDDAGAVERAGGEAPAG